MKQFLKKLFWKLLRPFFNEFNDALQQDLNNRFMQEEALLHDAQHEINIRFDGAEARLYNSEVHIEHASQRLDVSEERLNISEERLKIGEERHMNSEARLNTSEGRLASGEERLASGEERLASGEERLASGEERLASGEERLAALNESLARVEQNAAHALAILKGDLGQEEARRARYETLLNKNLGAVSRMLTKTKWGLVDLQESLHPTPKREITCGICGYTAARDTFETKTSQCIYNGGVLERYVCPTCGAVFGATKFTDMSQNELDDDYSVNYMGFHESDCTELEKRAFYMLKPSKGGVYLNYGCGSWSSSLQQLREEGYCVYGYEPYAPDTENPFMITNRDVLKKMRFDGVFSNDLLEHLLDPIEELRFMKTLLRSGEAKMSHSTCCYIYKYEYTRFHAFFFLGKSLEMLCEKAGVTLLEKVDDNEKNNFICWVYALADAKEERQKLLQDMLTQGDVQRNEQLIVLHEGALLCGPCIPLGAYLYRLTIELQFVGEQPLFCEVTADLGQEVLGEYQLVSGENNLDFCFSKPQTNVEFVLKNSLLTDVMVKRVTLLPQ